MIAVSPRPVIVIFLQTDFTTGASGYTSRCRDQVRFFAGFARTVVYSFYEDAERPWDPAAIARFHAQFPDVELVLDHRSLPLNALQRCKNAMLAWMPQAARRIVKLPLPGLTPAWHRLARKHPDALCLANLSEALAALNGVPFARLVIDTHDVRFVKQARMAGLPLSDRRIVTTQRSETAILSLAEAIVAISPADQAMFASLLPGARVLFIPDFAQRPAAPLRMPGAAREYDLLFVGSEYIFNVDGLCDFLQTHRLWLRDYRIAIAGKVCQDPRVIAAAALVASARLLGFVDDLAALYARSRLAISPVGGTGLKIKILEALAAGVPVCASAQSVEGLPAGYENCVFADSEAQMAALLADPAALGAASAAAAAYARQIGDAPDRIVLASLVSAGGAG